MPEKRTVKFKVGRLMKQHLGDITGATIDDEAGDIAEMSDQGGDDEESDSPEIAGAEGGAEPAPH